jgi:uncharacterized pyridoxal phosphate-dependent enzyme
VSVYESLGLRPVVNAYGNVTPLGGSVMEPEVLEAMAAAAGAYVDMRELLRRSGERIAELAGVDAAHITAGASAGLAVATAACMAGDDPARVARLPDGAGMPREVIVQRCQRTRWDQAVRVAGARLVEIGQATGTEPWELEAEIGERTAAVLYLADHQPHCSLPLAVVVDVARRHGVPVIVDAAAELPPAANLRAFRELGASLVIFSGGKMLRGPQASGLILGESRLIRACAANSAPNYGIGRSMKVGKEEIAGLLCAVERFLARDFEIERQRWEERVDDWLSALAALEFVHARRECPGRDDVHPTHVPRVVLRWEPESLGMTAAEVQATLMADDPPVAVGRFGDELVLNPSVLTAGEEHVVAERLVGVLSRHRQPVSAARS